MDCVTVWMTEQVRLRSCRLWGYEEDCHHLRGSFLWISSVGTSPNSATVEWLTIQHLITELPLVVGRSVVALQINFDKPTCESDVSCGYCRGNCGGSKEIEERPMKICDTVFSVNVKCPCRSKRSVPGRSSGEASSVKTDELKT
ncbi:hypothetical protein BaRGS_00003409 [Batillaria attramentaria]|uniref:Uncharacterized protein n=1 Tax=Batillaria attramentaria TaxID=370345 RepID=A0ABD0M0N9_9CAEN